MTINLTVKGLALPIEKPLLDKIKKALSHVEISEEAYAISINYRDKSYSAESGGFHPVEIGLTRKDQAWTLAYITDFAFSGGPYPELYKEVDFDFIDNTLYLVYGQFDLGGASSKEFYLLWVSNFVSYINMGAFDEVKVSVHD